MWKSKGHKINVLFDLQGDSFKFTQCYLFFPGGTVDLSILRRFDVGKSPILFTSISAIFYELPNMTVSLVMAWKFLVPTCFSLGIRIDMNLPIQQNIFQLLIHQDFCHLPWFNFSWVVCRWSLYLAVPKPITGKKQNVSPRHRGRRSLQRFTEPRMSPGPQEDERRLREVGRVGPSNKGTLPP